jgi:hypothetical protein
MINRDKLAESWESRNPELPLKKFGIAPEKSGRLVTLLGVDVN